MKSTEIKISQAYVICIFPLSSRYTMQPQLTSTKSSHKVAVIGAGAAGLVAARELREEGHQVVVFERSNKVGGTWVYDPNTESDPLGVDPARSIVHTSLYDSLRTNLPREVMGFRNFPFVAKDGEHRDPRRFPRHEEVLCYLNDFATEFKLSELIRFETEVLHVGMIEEKKWLVRSKGKDGNGEDNEEFFNAVVVCNGHYAKPNVAEIPGIDVWPGKQIHSHNYRVPHSYRNKVVVLIGSSASAFDISKDIAGVAKEVHLASRSYTNKNSTKQPGYDNYWNHSMIKSAHEDGTMVFEDKSSVLADIILHCTGYNFDFHFLDTGGVVTVDDNRVGPLYQHIFPPTMAPWLSFIGIPIRIITFPMFELQSKWVAGILSGRFSLPSQEEMISDVKDFYSQLESAGVPKRHTHHMAFTKFEYLDWLAAQCGYPPLEEWRREMMLSLIKNLAALLGNYRDEWEEEALTLQAHEDFLQYTSPADSSTGDSVVG